jgi:hypothetical protein
MRWIALSSVILQHLMECYRIKQQVKQHQRSNKYKKATENELAIPFEL